MTAKATSGITNLYLYRKYVATTDDDPAGDAENVEQLRYIIDETNSLIGQKCARNFGSTEYKEWVETHGESYVVVNNYPITKIKLCSLNNVDVLSVKATGFSMATARSNNASMILTTIATDGSTETENVLNYADYANVSSLVTAIDALSGWDGDIKGNNDNAITELIKPLDNEWCLNTDAYFQGPYQGSKAVISYDSDAVIDLGAQWYNDGGAFVGKWCFVWYVAGFEFPICSESGGELSTEGNVPEGLTLVANQIIKDVIDSQDEDQNMKSENIGDYSYTRGGISSAIDRHWQDLNQYSRKSV